MKKINKKVVSLACSLFIGISSVSSQASADEIIKLGMSLILSGSAGNWGIGSKWLCDEAAKEVAAAGGVKVSGHVYNFQCVAYDNKYNAADGAKVAQTLLSKDNVKYVVAAHGTATARALQSLSERRGVLMFTSAWGESLKGPKYPLTFTLNNGPREIVAPLVRYVKSANPQIRTVVLLNPNDASGKEVEAVTRQAWEAAGVRVIASDWFERGTSEFQPVAAKLAALKPDVVDLCASPAADSGRVFKELAALGWNGVKVNQIGTSAAGLLVTGQGAVENLYMGFATPQGGAIDKHRAYLNEGVRALTGEDVNPIQIASYDGVKALAAAMQKAQSIEPGAVAAALPKVTFDSFYGPAAFGGAATYGTPQQILIPAIVAQLKGNQLVEIERIQPQELSARLAD